MLKPSAKIIKTSILLFVILILTGVYIVSNYVVYDKESGVIGVGQIYKDSESYVPFSKSGPAQYLYAYHNKYAKLSTEDISKNVKWDSKEELFQADVLSVDVPNDTLSIRMAPPASYMYSSSIIVKPKCEVEDTVILDKMLSPVQVGSVLMKDIKPGYKLYSLCLNDDCTEIGKACLFGPAN